MIIHDNQRYVIEFKNQSEGNIDKVKIKNKAFDSISLNENLTREQIAKDTILVIVYNNERYESKDNSYSPSESIDKFTMKLKSLAKQENWEKYPKKI